MLVFDISGEWAHFRRYYTTTSPLTFPAPPRTAIIGILGSILGIEKDQNSTVFDPKQCRIAIQILNPARTLRVKENWRQGASGREAFQTARVPVELLRNPAFRLIVDHSDVGRLSQLRDHVEGERSHFTPYLGITECLAEISFVGWIDPKDQRWGTLGTIRCDSLVPRLAVDFDFSAMKNEDYHLVEHIFPYVGTPDRQFTYHRVLMERRGRSFPVIAKTQPLLWDGKVYFFLEEPLPP